MERRGEKIFIKSFNNKSSGFERERERDRKREIKRKIEKKRGREKETMK